MFQIERINRALGQVMRQNAAGELEYLTFPALEDTGMVEHLFTTRSGGVSKGIFESMNLSYTRGDDAEHVYSNYLRVAEILHCSPKDMVVSQQTHTANIRYVTEEDRGKGVVRPLDYENVDGLVTDRKGLALVTLYADCVPLYFLDPVHCAVGLAHSGWRGTVQEIGRKMTETMTLQFGTDPEDLVAAIGPSICQDCYEVSGDVAEEFRALQEENGEYLREIQESKKLSVQGGGRPVQVILPGRKEGKYQLDLWLANLLVLRKAGIKLDHISVTDLCTCHNPGYLFSHRASNGKRGNLGAFLMLKKS